MNLSGKNVVVVGLGKSGQAAVRLLKEHGARVLGTDSAPLEWLPAGARELGIELRAGGHEGVRFDTADLVVVSPGVPSFAALERAVDAGVEVIGELELACRFVDAPLVAIGGTNGKSTTTTLVGELLSAGGNRVFVGGNLGTPAAEAAVAEYDFVVLEVSSFQLERAPRFHPQVNVLLNVTDDHLDRYPSFSAYAEAKGNSFVNQVPGDAAIVPFGDALCEEQARRGKGDLVTFGRAGDYAVEDGAVVEAKSGERFSLSEARLFGRHNHDNAAAAIAAVRALSTSAESVRLGLRRFEPLPHRMVFVGEIGGVRYYDDSKATNVGAAVTALAGLSEPKAVLIAGGRDKHGSYAPLVDVLRERARAVVVLGEAAGRIFEAVGGAVPVERAETLEDAVERAARLAEPGDAVLLSPACSSLDMFKSYAERGDRFTDAVRKRRQR